MIINTVYFKKVLFLSYPNHSKTTSKAVFSLFLYFFSLTGHSVEPYSNDNHIEISSNDSVEPSMYASSVESPIKDATPDNLSEPDKVDYPDQPYSDHLLYKPSNLCIPRKENITSTQFSSSRPRIAGIYYLTREGQEQMLPVEHASIDGVPIETQPSSSVNLSYLSWREVMNVFAVKPELIERFPFKISPQLSPQSGKSNTRRVENDEGFSQTDLSPNEPLRCCAQYSGDGLLYHQAPIITGYSVPVTHQESDDTQQLKFNNKNYCRIAIFIPNKKELAAYLLVSVFDRYFLAYSPEQEENNIPCCKITLDDTIPSLTTNNHFDNFDRCDSGIETDVDFRWDAHSSLVKEEKTVSTNIVAAIEKQKNIDWNENIPIFILTEIFPLKDVTLIIDVLSVDFDQSIVTKISHSR